MSIILEIPPKSTQAPLARATGSNASRRLTRLPLVLAGAAMLAGFLTSIPWLDERAFPAAWIGMSLWIAITSNQQPHTAFRLWMLGGIVVLGVWFHWLPSVAAQHLQVGMVAGIMVALLAVTWDALRFGLFGYFVAALESRGVRSIFIWPVVWVSLEWLWPHLFPWRIGQSQLGWLPLCQIAEFTGAFGVSFVFMWGSSVTGALLQSAVRRTASVQQRALMTQAIPCMVVLLVIVGWGTWRMKQIDGNAATRPSLQLALVQPGSKDEQMLSRLQGLSRQVALGMDLVIWGESTVGDFPLDHKSFHCDRDVPGPCPSLGCPLLCGGLSFAPGTSETGPYNNTAFLIATDETIIGRYHKRVLMPWGEYAVGQQWLPGLRDLLCDVDALVPGSSAAPLALSRDVHLGVLICYEDLMPGPARETVLKGANVLVNLNNLSLFGRTAALWQHQHLAKLRAIENRRWLVRCGTTGSTAVISATGRVVQQAPTNAPAVLVMNVPQLDGLTVYTLMTDWFAWLCFAITLLFLARYWFGQSTRGKNGEHPRKLAAGLISRQGGT